MSFSDQNTEGELTDLLVEISDRVAFFDNGEFVVDGPPEDIFFHFENERLKEFLNVLQAPRQHPNK